jgi:hypothetical protein
MPDGPRHGKSTLIWDQWKMNNRNKTENRRGTKANMALEGVHASTQQWPIWPSVTKCPGVMRWLLVHPLQAS